MASELVVYNTLSNSKEPFKPLKGKKVGMYVCGVTVYDEPHLGHARCYVAFDIVRRYLEYRGYKVKHIQNFTDIDDKIINRAVEDLKKSNVNIEGDALKNKVKEIADKYTEEYYKQMDSLGIKRAYKFPKATEHINKMIKLIKTLIAKEHAYEADGDVFFKIRSFKGYGKLSGRSLDEMEAGARVEVDKKKKDPLDFVLWKSSKENEPWWESPWGKGRPGWHIECSCMSMKYLGESIDIHGGGQDLIFPHHENEICQSEAGTGKDFSKYWIHNGFVTINREKMSKSLGNFFTLREIYEKYDPEVVRFFLISTHYRSPIDFSDDKLEEARTAIGKVYNMLGNIDALLKMAGKIEAVGQNVSKPDLEKVKKSCIEAMDDDFNTAKALGVVFEFVGNLNVFMTGFSATKENIKYLKNAKGLIEEVGEVLGLFRKEPQVMKDESEEIMDLIERRNEARKKKDWKEADRVRDELNKRGIVLEDTSRGTIWKRK